MADRVGVPAQRAARGPGSERQVRRVEPDVSVVVPFVDEADNLPPLLEELADLTRGRRDLVFELLFVDDGSRDGGTEALLGSALAEELGVVLLGHRRNHGKSAALLTGFAAARAPVVVTLDADLQNPPAEVAALLDELERGGWDAVLGVRRQRRDSWSVRLASRVANAVRRLVLHDEVRDIGCGLVAFRRELAVDLPRFEGLHRFLPPLWRSRGARIAQIPVRHRPRRQGASKYTIAGRAWRGLFDLVGVRWWLARAIEREEALTRRGHVPLREEDLTRRGHATPREEDATPREEDATPLEEGVAPRDQDVTPREKKESRE